MENPYVKVSNSVTGVRKIETVKGKLIKSTSLEKVEDLMKAYESLGEAARIVNKCYGLVIAVIQFTRINLVFSFCVVDCSSGLFNPLVGDCLRHS